MTYRVIVVEGVEEAVEMLMASSLKVGNMKMAQPIINQMLGVAYRRRWDRWNGYLLDTGRLRKSFTDDDGPDSIRQAHYDSVEYGSSVPYSRFYLSQLLEVDNRMVDDLATALADYYAGMRVTRGHWRAGTWVQPYVRARVAPLVDAHG